MSIEKLPGLMDVFEPDAPGMHTTDSVDYGICLEGDLYLELDDGAEVRLTPGACVCSAGPATPGTTAPTGPP